MVLYIFTMKTLFTLNYEKLKTLVCDTLNIEHWFIRNDKIKSRTDSIEYSERFKYLQNRARDCNFLFNNTEIVSWLDTLTTMYYVFDSIKDDYLKTHITILQEYCIPFSNKRADYLLVYDNKILIIEFSFNKLGYEFNYETKLQQAISYKELLSNILPKEIEIGTYTFLLEPEEDRYGNAIYINDGNDLPNNPKIEDMANYIVEYFNKNINLAINSLRQLNSKR